MSALARNLQTSEYVPRHKTRSLLWMRYNIPNSQDDTTMIQTMKTSMIVTPNSAMGANLDKMYWVTWEEINKTFPLPNL